MLLKFIKNHWDISSINYKTSKDQRIFRIKKIRFQFRTIILKLEGDLFVVPDRNYVQITKTKYRNAITYT